MAGQVDEIKARLDITEVVSEYIRLKQAGTNYRALCPFHNEKSPSFMVSKDKQIFHCFGCSEGGDVFTFVQKMEGIDFAEALKILAQKAGIKLEHVDPKLASQKNKLSDITKFTQEFWHKTLLESQSAAKARDYLKGRGITKETIEEFKFGYAVDSWDVLLNALKAKGFKDQEIFLAGLAIKKDRGEGFYDRFRDRVMFPINDLHGNPIGFTGRTLKEDEKGGKYVNTPSTLLYNKSLAIFNLDKAKQEIKRLNFAIIVEGQMDVISSWQAGTKNVVASSGTAMTLDQITILKRYTNNLAIAFDADAAGQAAAKKGIDIAVAQEMNVKVIVVPGGKDPDECIKNNPDDWRKAIGDAKSIIQYYFDETFGRVDLTSVDGKKEAVKILLTEIAKIPNKVEQVHWIQKLADSTNVPESVLHGLLQPSKQAVKNPDTNEAITKPAVKSKNAMLYDIILAISLKYPDNIPYLIDHLEPEVIMDQGALDLYKKVIIYYTENISGNIDQFDYQDFKTTINSNELEALADKLVLFAEKDFFDFDTVAIKEELIKAIHFSKKNFYTNKLQQIEHKIKEAERVGDKEEIERLVKESSEVISQVNLLT